MRLRRRVRAGRLTVWALPVLVVAVLAAVSAQWGLMVSAVVLGFIVMLAIGWVLGVGIDPEPRQSTQQASRWRNIQVASPRRAKEPAPRPTAVDPSVANFSPAQSRLSGADLTGADLTGADLRGLDLRNVNLTRAVLREANLKGARLSQEPDEH